MGAPAYRARDEGGKPARRSLRPDAVRAGLREVPPDGRIGSRQGSGRAYPGQSFRNIGMAGYGLSSHGAAACVSARRGSRFKLAKTVFGNAIKSPERKRTSCGSVVGRNGLPIRRKEI